MGRLEGKIAVITGGGDGMGASHCRLFSKEGASLLVTDRREEPGQKIVDEIVSGGGKAVFVGQDVANEDDWKKVAAATMEHYGKADILINNAAIASFKSAKDATLDEWNLIMDVCAKSIFLGCKYMLPAMQAAGGGSIVNISPTKTHPRSATMIRTGPMSRTLRLAIESLRTKSTCFPSITIVISFPVSILILFSILDLCIPTIQPVGIG
ncbi:MAG: hypothetical protein COC20_02875 [Cellvibrionales bacterium]|nr:MAG: hypothetical protein COC20_02875 [Cellvibrionales bacterium]